MADVLVRTDRGRVRGVADDGVACFRGIPFASAPEGPLRFLPPVPAAAWEGVRDAVAFGTAPPPGRSGAGSAVGLAAR
jgi:carboxylesterase type B